MGGSSSKKENEKKNKEEEIEKPETSEKVYKKLENIIIDKENNINIINIIDTNKKIEEKNIYKKAEEALNDSIEVLTLEKNGMLTRNEKKINSYFNPAITIEIQNSQTELNNIISMKNSQYNNNEDIKIKEEEPIIIYSEIASQELIINFYEKMIDITYSFSFRKDFIALVKSLNESYLYNLNINKFPKTKEVDDFLYSFKYSSIIIVCLVFLSKDYDLFDNTKKKIKDFLEQFIITCLESTNKDIILSLKIINFLNPSRKIKKTLYNCVYQILRILFKIRESYQNIYNCLEQLFSKINNFNNNNNNNIIITKRRKSMIKKSKISLKKYFSPNTGKVLYRNVSYCKGLTLQKFKNRNGIESNTTGISKNDIIPPFIKEEMPKNKKFCLVLDIDETISHLVKLPFGNYFLIRPGVIELLKELYKYYEIDIFTAALQNYADNILDKLDKNKIYFSHRLYRCHCSWEDGKSIKKLELIGRDLNKIAFVDDIERNAKYNMKNLILVSKWSDDIFDEEIINITNKLKIIAETGKYDEDITQGLLDENLTKINNNPDKKDNNG